MSSSAPEQTKPTKDPAPVHPQTYHAPTQHYPHHPTYDHYPPYNDPYRYPHPPNPPRPGDHPMWPPPPQPPVTPSQDGSLPYAFPHSPEYPPPQSPPHHRPHSPDYPPPDHPPPPVLHVPSPPPPPAPSKVDVQYVERVQSQPNGEPPKEKEAIPLPYQSLEQSPSKETIPCTPEDPHHCPPKVNKTQGKELTRQSESPNKSTSYHSDSGSYLSESSGGPSSPRALSGRSTPKDISDSSGSRSDEASKDTEVSGLINSGRHIPVLPPPQYIPSSRLSRPPRKAHVDRVQTYLSRVGTAHKFQSQKPQTAAKSKVFEAWRKVGEPVISSRNDTQSQKVPKSGLHSNERKRNSLLADFRKSQERMSFLGLRSTEPRSGSVDQQKNLSKISVSPASSRLSVPTGKMQNNSSLSKWKTIPSYSTNNHVSKYGTKRASDSSENESESKRIKKTLKNGIIKNFKAIISRESSPVNTPPVKNGVKSSVLLTEEAIFAAVSSVLDTDEILNKLKQSPNCKIVGDELIKTPMGLPVEINSSAVSCEELPLSVPKSDATSRFKSFSKGAQIITKSKTQSHKSGLSSYNNRTRVEHRLAIDDRGRHHHAPNHKYRNEIGKPKSTTEKKHSYFSEIGSRKEEFSRHRIKSDDNFVRRKPARLLPPDNKFKSQLKPVERSNNADNERLSVKSEPKSQSDVKKIKRTPTKQSHSAKDTEEDDKRRRKSADTGERTTKKSGRVALKVPLPRIVQNNVPTTNQTVDKRTKAKDKDHPHAPAVKVPRKILKPKWSNGWKWEGKGTLENVYLKVRA